MSWDVAVDLFVVVFGAAVWFAIAYEAGKVRGRRELRGALVVYPDDQMVFETPEMMSQEDVERVRRAVERESSATLLTNGIRLVAVRRRDRTSEARDTSAVSRDGHSDAPPVRREPSHPRT